MLEDVVVTRRFDGDPWQVDDGERPVELGVEVSQGGIVLSRTIQAGSPDRTYPSVDDLRLSSRDFDRLVEEVDAARAALNAAISAGMQEVPVR